MEKNLIKFPPIPSQLETSNIFTNLKYFGPGAIIVSMTIGSGEAIFASRGGGIFCCGLWCFAMIWSDKKFLPEPYRMGKILTVLTIISGIGLTSFGVIAITDYIRTIF